MNYLAVHIKCPQDIQDILIAEFSLLPFDTFEEKEDGFSAFCLEVNFAEKEIASIIKKYSGSSDIDQRIEVIPKVNWNEEWEKNFDPVMIDDRITVRAPFHEPSGTEFEILLDPKMAFGTGHHPTTYLMLRSQLQLDHKGKIVIDFGTGTGILTIMASKLGAKKILATDIDTWCIENSIDNFKINDIIADIRLGTVDKLDIDFQADIILANINRNILIEEMSQYVSKLKAGGTLLLSGFYVRDIPILLNATEKKGLQLQSRDEKDDWAVLVLTYDSL